MSAANVITSIGQQAVTSATPLVLAGVGELVAERAGVINIGIEGLMLTGCIAAFAATIFTSSGLAGVLCAAAAAMVLALVFALVAVWWKADQIVAGTAINLIAAGISGTAWAALQHGQHADLSESLGFNRWPLAGLARFPVAGPIFFNQYGLWYGTVILAVGAGMALRRTRTGLIIRALGESPSACDAAGISVRAWRTGCVVCGGLRGAGGGISFHHAYQIFAPAMTGGQGFLVLALVIFGRWKIWGLVAGCLFFGIIQSLQEHLQGSSGFLGQVPYPYFQMLPYAAALAALALLARGTGGPAALGRPWPEEIVE